MTKCLLYVPTNRECNEAICAYSAEAEYLSKISPHTVFALIESNEANHTTQHAALLADLSLKRDVPLIHLDLPLQRRLIEEILNRTNLKEFEQEWLGARLMPLENNYGAGPNKAALLACALGANSLHRRDSDTMPQVYDGIPLYPAAIEGRLLGRSIQQGDGLVEYCGKTQGPIFCVGTDYEGSAALDRVEFSELSPELLIEHERLEHPDESADGLRARVDRKFLRRDQSPYSGDVIELDTTGRAEMGACSIMQVFRYLPEMPIGNTLGSDYFQKNLLYRLDLPVLYHNRRVHHSHKGIRNLKSADEFIRYSLRDLHFKLLKQIWRTHNQYLMETLNGKHHEAFDAFFDSGEYADSLERAVLVTSKSEQAKLLEDLSRLYYRAGNLAGPAGEKFHEVARHVSAHGHDHIRFVTSGFHDYAKLVRIWRKIVQVAEELADSDWGWRR